MIPKDLTKIWNAPDHSKLTPKQISLRLPIQVSAKISALCDMYPRKTKTEIIGDLLATALDQLEDGLYEEGKLLGAHPQTGEQIHEESGNYLKFNELTQKYLQEMETEIEGIKNETKIK